jgi:hypothetical protein
MASYIMLTIGISAIACAAILWVRDLLTWSFLDEDCARSMLRCVGNTWTIYEQSCCSAG